MIDPECAWVRAAHRGVAPTDPVDYLVHPMSPPTRALLVPAGILLGALASPCARAAVSPALAQSPVRAQTSDQESGDVAANAQDLDAGPSLELSLERAQAIALERNLGLQIESVNTEVAWYNHRASWGKFDWVVDARAGFTDAEFQPRDVFGGSSERSQDFSFGLTRPIALTGGTFSSQFGSATTRTDRDPGRARLRGLSGECPTCEERTGTAD
jgi:hypothetical protein